MPGMYDLRYGVLKHQGEWLGKHANPKPASPALAKVASAFTSNIFQVHGLTELPVRAMIQGYEDGWDEAFREHGPPVIRGSQQAAHRRIETWDRVWDYFNRIPQIVFPHGIVHFRSMLIDSMRSSLVACWTAFETLATDLWTDALNECPIFAYNAAKPTKTRKPRGKSRGKPEADDDPAIDNDAGKTVTVEQLKLHNFDLRKRMGTVLRAGRKFNFNRLDGIKGAYSASFGDDANRIFLAKSHLRLTVLEGLRNVFVHNAGKVDAKFLGRVRDEPAAYGALAAIPFGEPIPVDGEMVREFCELPVSVCVGLLDLADRRIASNNTGDGSGANDS